jgi:hypothetical protein
MIEIGDMTMAAFVIVTTINILILYHRVGKLERLRLSNP